MKNEHGLTFAQWCDSLTTEDRYDFDSEGRGFKKDCGTMMRLAWDAAWLQSASGWRCWPRTARTAGAA